ncbi:MAG TPA: aspartate aminotransferase family protein [Methyloceanibacter sp.]|jgi:4-aminobutyrate aminotransferase-like enzyme
MTATRKILELNAFDMDASSGLDPETADLVARRRRVFGPTSMLFYARPLNLVRGEGVWLIGADGTRYLDAYNNVASVGHCHPRVVAAVSRQMATLNTHSRYLSEIVYTYAERLLATLPRELSNIVLTCTGSESVDLALRIARAVTGGTGLIVTANAYHGNTRSATEISPSSASAEPPNPHVFLVPAPDTYRTMSKDVGPRFAANVRKAIAAMKRKKIRFAGLIADSIFSSDGIYSGEPGFMAEAIASVRKEGGMFIADEVQPGFARTGETMWGFERHGLVPDMVVMGKPMGNGYPIGGVAVKPNLLEAFGATSGYFNTFGGNPVAAAAGLAVLETIEAETLQQNALEIGAYLLAELDGVAQRFSQVGDLRGKGLYIGVELVRDRKSKKPDREAATRIVDMLRDRNVLVGIAGPHGNVLKIRPPLCFERDHADLLVKALSDSLAALS